LLVSGDTEAAISTILDIVPLLEEVNVCLRLFSVCKLIKTISISFFKNHKFNNAESTAELRLLIHQSQAGCVIGRGGDKIKELRIVSIFNRFKQSFQAFIFALFCDRKTIWT